MAPYKHLISKWADPAVAVALGLVAFKQYELKDKEPSLLELVQENRGQK